MAGVNKSSTLSTASKPEILKAIGEEQKKNRKGAVSALGKAVGGLIGAVLWQLALPVAAPAAALLGGAYAAYEGVVAVSHLMSLAVLSGEKRHVDNGGFAARLENMSARFSKRASLATVAAIGAVAVTAGAWAVSLLAPAAAPVALIVSRAAFTGFWPLAAVCMSYAAAAAGTSSICTAALQREVGEKSAASAAAHKGPPLLVQTPAPKTQFDAAANGNEPAKENNTAPARPPKPDAGPMSPK
jgi:hypothetical protein